MKSVGIGIIGCGAMGRVVAKELLKHSNKLQLRGLCDPDKGSIQKCCEELNSSPKVYRDYQSLIKSPDIDWVMVASWNCHHRDQVISAFKAGIAGTIETKRIGFDTKIENVAAGVKGGHGGGDEILGKELADSILKGTKLATGLTDGIKSAITCFAIDKAMETGRVVNMEPYWRRMKKV
jgi:hypothetical protein